MKWNTFEWLYKYTMNLTFVIFNIERIIINLNNIYELQRNPTTLTNGYITTGRADGQTNQTFGKKEWNKSNITFILKLKEI